MTKESGEMDLVEFAETLAAAIVNVTVIDDRPRGIGELISLLSMWLLPEKREQELLLQVVEGLQGLDAPVDLRSTSQNLQTIAALLLVLHDGNGDRVRGGPRPSNRELEIEAQPSISRTSRSKLLN